MHKSYRLQLLWKRAGKQASVWAHTSQRIQRDQKQEWKRSAHLVRKERSGWGCWSHSGEGKGEWIAAALSKPGKSWQSLEAGVAAWHPAPQRGWRVAGPDRLWFTRKAQGWSRGHQEPSLRILRAWELAVAQGLPAQVKNLIKRNWLKQNFLKSRAK